MTERTLLTNARLPGHPDLFSITVSAGKIESIRLMSEASPFGSTLLDLKGGWVLPGLWDAHLHLELLTFRLNSIDCETPTIQECLEAVKNAAIKHDDDQWLIGFNWNHNIWKPARYGTAQQLDAVSARHPVLLHAKSLHASWANSVALHLAGIDENTPNPLGGEILRDSHGYPTGILLENATSLVEKIIPKTDARSLADLMLVTQAYLHRLGITGVHDFDRFESFEALRVLFQRGDNRLEMVKNLPATAIDLLTEIDFRKEIKDMGMIPGWVKAFADGALGPQSAAMVEPYENSTDRGMLLIDPEEILELGLKAAKAHWPLAIHAIGDAANHAVLDGFALLRKAETKYNLPHLPHRIEHAQCLLPQDFRRFQELRLIASVQPIHYPSDRQMANKYWGKRIAFAYAYASLHQAGAKLVCGSDAPVESPNPFLGIQAAVNHPLDVTSDKSEGWPDNQNLPIEVVLQAYTQAPAQISGLDHVGKLEAGHAANFIVLPSNPYSIDSDELGKLTPQRTFFHGQLVFEM